ncbi:MAG: 16S rRNA (guanine(527)-N(7))-methyltransferase RsmG, partial [bacterium]
MEKADAQIITNYFHNLTSRQVEQIQDLHDLYACWNQRINVISRKDFENFYIHHVLHSLGIAKIVHFKPGTEIIDVGTGGGFPGIPLAILFPDVRFCLVDSIGKKIHVVREVAEALQLKNVTWEHNRAEKIKRKFDFIISRAVTNLPDFVRLTAHLVRPSGNNELNNG